MLKLIRVPDESTFTESDLKPDLKVAHKDGRQFTLNKHGDSYWTLTHQGVAYLKSDMVTLMFPREIIPLLNRDFRRAEDAPPQYKTVGEVPVGWLFDTECHNLLYKSDWTPRDFNGPACVSLASGVHYAPLKSTPVTRVHGPLTIDPKLLEGAK